MSLFRRRTFNKFELIVLLLLVVVRGSMALADSNRDDRAIEVQRRTVIVYLENRAVCFGYQYDEFHIITAAHCLMGADSQTKMYLQNFQEQLKIPVVKTDIFPGFQMVSESQRIGVDLMLLTTAFPAKKMVEPRVWPWAKPSSSLTSYHILAGEDIRDQGGQLMTIVSNLLQINENEIANLRQSNFYTDIQVKKGIQVPCRRDSGGLVLGEVDGEWVLLGLVTNGNCTDRFTFVNVYSQQSWLNTFEQNYK